MVDSFSVDVHRDEMKYELHLGDCLEVMRTLPDASVDSCVTDPPYELGFMGKAWDSSGVAYDPNTWREVLRVLKPGAHLLAFGGTRTYHRMAVAIEDAGFEIRDQMQWIYGSGFPKSLDVSKAIDTQGEGQYRRAYVQAVQEAGLVLPSNSKWDWTVGEHSPGNKWWKTFCEWLPSLSELDRERVNRIVIGKGFKPRPTFHTGNIGSVATANEYDITAPTSDEAKQWNGWGTGLKPANEPICLARKPLEKGLTVAQNVLKWGTGGLNIDGCRIEIRDEDDIYAKNPHTVGTIGANGIYGDGKPTLYEISKGRWPANVIHDGSDEVLANFPQSEVSGSAKNGTRSEAICTGLFGTRPQGVLHNDSGSAARFFYCAKASRRERGNGNQHPTVKPTKLMQYLCRLVAPRKGATLDPFMGSGSTGVAALMEGRTFIGIEKDEDYFNIAKERIEGVTKREPLFEEIPHPDEVELLFMEQAA